MCAGYKITLHNTARRKAGVGSNIFITLFGTWGSSDEYRINRFLRRRGQEGDDTVLLKLPEDIGDIYKIELRMDCTPPTASWIPDYVNVQKDVFGAPISHFSYRKHIKDPDKKILTVSSGLPISEEKHHDIILIPSGECFFVFPGQTLQYTQHLRVPVGYSLKETRLTQLGEHTSIALDTGTFDDETIFDVVPPFLKDSISFALQTLAARDGKKHIILDGNDTVRVNVTIENRRDVPQRYVVMLSVSRNLHKVKFGDLHFSIPEYLSTSFDGIREI